MVFANNPGSYSPHHTRDIYHMLKRRHSEDHAPYHLVLLILITMIAGAIRFYRLGAWSFWVDEIFTLNNAEDIFQSGFLDVLISHPISVTLIRVTLEALGTNEWSARLIPAVIGVVSIPILYVPVRNIWGPAVALGAVFLLAISPWHLYFSQNARYYTALMLFYMLAFFAFYFGLEKNRSWYLLAALVFLWLAFRERLFALLFLPVVAGYIGALYILPFERPAGLRIKRVLTVTGVIGGLAGAYLLYDAFVTGPESRSLVNALFAKFFGQPDWIPRWLLTGAVHSMGVPVAGLALYGSIHVLWQRSRAGLYVVMGAFVPLVTLMVLAPFARTTTHYALMILPCWMILAALGVRDLYRQATVGNKWVVLLWTLIILGASLKDRTIADVGYYRGATLYYSLFIDVVLAGALLVAGCLIWAIIAQQHGGAGYSHWWNRLRMAVQSGKAHVRQHPVTLLWVMGIVMPLLLQPAVKNTLYYAYEHGSRADWKTAAAIVEERKADGDVVFTTLPPLGTYYFGEAALPMGDLLSREHIDLNTVLKQYRRAWFIEEAGVDQLMGNDFAEWADANCDLIKVLDNYIAGANWKLRVHLCEQSIIQAER